MTASTARPILLEGRSLASVRNTAATAPNCLRVQNLTLVIAWADYTSVLGFDVTEPRLNLHLAYRQANPLYPHGNAANDAFDERIHERIH